MPATLPRVHVLVLAVGDCFRFEPEGRIYRVVVLDDRGLWVESADGVFASHQLDYEGCFVHPIDTEEGDDES